MRNNYELPVTYFTSSLVLLLGYCLFVVGMITPSWRTEIGYVYGLWVQCDLGVCQHTAAGFTTYLALVRCGIMVSLVLLTISMICLLLEIFMRSRYTALKHIIRVSKAIAVTTLLGEIIAGASLAVYGCKTVLAHEKLPALTWGFALTGIGVMTCLTGSILRTMGPPSTWGDGACCMAPRHRLKGNLPGDFYVDGSDPSTSELFPYQPKDQRRINGNDKVKLISCFHTSKKGYSYNSISSTMSSSLERGYRHYEEISFEDMPPPPLELLNSYPLINPTHGYHHEQWPPYPYQDAAHQSAEAGTGNWTHTSYPHTEHSLQNQQDTVTSSQPIAAAAEPQQHFTPLMASLDAQPVVISTHSSHPHPPNHPPITPRQTTKQRTVPRSETTHHHSSTVNSMAYTSNHQAMAGSNMSGMASQHTNQSAIVKPRSRKSSQRRSTNSATSRGSAQQPISGRAHASTQPRTASGSSRSSLHGSRTAAPRTRYQTMPVNPSHVQNVGNSRRCRGSRCERNRGQHRHSDMMFQQSG